MSPSPGKPRAAIVAPSVGHGMAPLTHAVCEMMQQGFDIALFCPARYPYTHDQVRVETMPSADSKLARAVRLFDPRAVKSLVGKVEAWRPDVVHIFNSEGYPWSLAVSGWARRNAKPLITTIHDPKPHPGSASALVNGQLAKVTLSNTTLIHLFDDNFRERITAHHSAPIAIAPYPTISGFYLAHRRPDVAREDMVLLFGRLEAYKGVEVLVDAAAYLPAGMKVVIAGPGSVELGVRKKIEAAPERFELHERFLSDAEVANFFQRASVMALPYLEVTQSQLHVIAADFGVPTVASDLGFFRTDVPRYGGLLAKAADPQALAAAITEARGKKPLSPDGEGDVAASWQAMYRQAIGLKA